MAKSDYLQLKRRKWWYIRRIPRELSSKMLQPFTGKAHYRVNLHTSDVIVAQEKRLEADMQFNKAVSIARKRVRGDADAELLAEMQGWAVFVKGDGPDLETSNAIVVSQSIGAPLGEDEEATGRLAEIERQFGSEVAQKFYKRAMGIVEGTEIDQHLLAFCLENPAKPHTQQKRKRIINDLAKWRSSLFVESIDLATARQFVEEKIVPGRKPETINGDITILSTYWGWMIKRGHITDAKIVNQKIPWTQFRRKKTIKESEERQRAFSEKEFQLIFNNIERARPELRDFCKIAALTGARLSEIGHLKVKHIDTRAMTILLPGTKTLEAERQIPMHEHLLELFNNRCAKKAEEEWVFPELPTRSSGDLKSRSSPISKSFTRFRRSIGVGIGSEGNTRSVVNFHSFRHWATTKLQELDTPNPVMDRIFGWSSQAMRSRYATGADMMRQMRDAISKLKLPP